MRISDWSSDVCSSDLGDTVGVAWNRSTETARLIGQSLPLLRAARRAVVIEIEGWSIPGPDGAALVDYLRLHGVAAEGVPGPRSTRPEARSVGEEVFSTCISRWATY